ncbi:uncharacterized protein A1O9_02028, partial [Exophiala aquamarina CBS 119918]
YRVAAGKPLAVNACHCGACQRVSGGPFLGFADYDSVSVSWTQPPDIWASSEFAERGYCKICGSAISMMYLFERERIGLTLGTIKEADPPIPGITYHIFLSEKAPWFVVPEDGATRQAGFGDEFQAKVDKWKMEQGTNNACRSKL